CAMPSQAAFRCWAFALDCRLCSLLAMKQLATQDLVCSHKVFPRFRQPIGCRTWDGTSCGVCVAAHCSKGFRKMRTFISRIPTLHSMREKQESRCAITAPHLLQCLNRETFSRRNFTRKNRDLPAHKCSRISCGSRIGSDEPSAPHHSLPRYRWRARRQ